MAAPPRQPQPDCHAPWNDHVQDVHFDFDRFNLRPDALKILDDAIAKLQANPMLNVTIEGHCATASAPSSTASRALGERRANSVRECW